MAHGRPRGHRREISSAGVGGTLSARSCTTRRPSVLIQCALVFGLFAASGGCGSIIGTSLHVVPYAGVQADAFRVRGGGILGVAAVIDFPFSGVVDTVLLPFTVPYAYAACGSEDGWATWAKASRLP